MYLSTTIWNSFDIDVVKRGSACIFVDIGCNIESGDGCFLARKSSSSL